MESPYNTEATAWKVMAEQQADGEVDASGGGAAAEPDMSVFSQQSSRPHFKICQTALQARTGHSEFIVYDTRQIRLKYLIELTSPEWVKREFERK